MLRPDKLMLEIKMTSDSVSIMDTNWIVGLVDNLAMAGVWGALSSQDIADVELLEARNAIYDTFNHRKSMRRFHPEFYSMFGDWMDKNDSNQIGRRFRIDIKAFDPFDPLDIGIQLGMNVWLKTALQQYSPSLAESVFSFAQAERVEKKSPLVVTLAVGTAMGIGLPALLVYGCMIAAVRVRRQEAEARIREIEVDLKHEELRQQRLRTTILESLSDGIHELASEKKLTIPDEVLTETARVASVSVANLGSTPLIGSVTLGLSAK